LFYCVYWDITDIFHVNKTSELLRCKNSYGSEQINFNTALTAHSNTAFRLLHMKKAFVYLLDQPFNDQHCKRAEHTNDPTVKSRVHKFSKKSMVSEGRKEAFPTLRAQNFGRHSRQHSVTCSVYNTTRR